MRIAIVGPYYLPLLSGIEKTMEMHARLLKERGHDVLVITSKLRFPDGEFDVPSKEVLNGVPVTRVAVKRRRPPSPFSYPSNGGLVITGLDDALGAFKPDVIHVHNVGAPAWANEVALYAEKAKVPFAYSTHHHPDHLRFDRLRKTFLRRLNAKPMQSAKRIYHLTSIDYQLLLEDYPKANQDAFAVLPAGVSPPRLPQSVGEKVDYILFVGRVDDERKGFRILEAAYDMLRDQRKDTPPLMVVGDISEASANRLNDKYGPCIDVAGSVEETDLERRYAGAGLFVMPSFYEGFGMPYIEAMRYGVPVIGTSIGGIPEVVPTTAGALVPAGDYNALADAMTTILSSADLRSRMGDAGRQWSERFHWNRIVDGLERDYSTMTGKSASSV